MRTGTEDIQRRGEPARYELTEFGGFDFNIPANATITGVTITPPNPPNPRNPPHPNLNDHLCCTNIMNANGSIITLAILMAAYHYHEISYGNMEPDGLWAEVHMYARVRQLITETPNFHRYNDPTTDHLNHLNDIRFMAATLYVHDKLPPNEILFYNSTHPEYSIRIINLGAANAS